MLFPTKLPAEFPELTFSADRVEFQGGEVYSVKGLLGPGGQLDVEAGALSMVSRPEEIRKLNLHCSLLKDGEGSWCPEGGWSLELGGLHMDQPFSTIRGTIGKATLIDGNVRLSGHIGTAGLEAVVSLENNDDGWLIEFEWTDQRLDSLKNLQAAPTQFQWLTRGESAGQMQLRIPVSGVAAVHYQLELNEISFDSPEGRFAGESLQIESSGAVTLGSMVSARVKGRINSGEMLVDDFYRNFSGTPLSFEAQPVLKNSALEISGIAVTDNSALWLEGGAALDLTAAENGLTFHISRLDLSFPGAYKRYIEPVVAVWTLNGLDMAGQISWSGDWTRGRFESGELLLTDLTVVDGQRGRFAVTGLDGSLRPGDHDFDSRLNWRGLLLGRVNLGEGEINLESKPGRVAIEQPLELEVLGGQLTFHELAVDLPGSMATVEQDLDFQLRADLRGLNIEQLTDAMDWPTFSGDISGEIPAVSLNDGVLSVDGEILLEVFDGRISVSDLSVERPFGVLPSLAATADIYNLDLEQLTRTFSFGQISGRMDGYVRDLRMLDWKPVAFDAWFGTPERQGKSNDISRNAVNRLTTLGGGSATAALTGPIMKLFNNFSYRRLGLGCHLHDNICDLRGISEDDASVLIMEGAGLPKIMIRAFNRSLDWQQLLAGLVAVSGDEQIKVGD